MPRLARSPLPSSPVCAKTRREKILVGLAILLLPVAGAKADETDDVARREMQKQHIPGLSLAVVCEGCSPVSAPG